MAITAWGAEIRANSNIEGSQDQSVVAALHDGGYVVVWTDFDPNPSDGSSSSVWLQRYDAAGNAVSGNVLLNAGSIQGAQDTPDVAVLGDGSLLVAWRDDGDPILGSRIAFRRVSAEGEPSPGGVQWVPSGIGEYEDPSVLARAGGGFTILAKTIGGGTAYSFDYNADGGFAGNDVLLSAGLQGPEMAYLEGGQIVTVWDDGTGNHIQVGMLQTNGTSSLVTATEIASPFHTDPEVVDLSNGGLAVAWTRGRGGTGSSDVYARLFGADGQPKGAAFRANVETIGHQSEPELVATRDGGFAVIFQSAGNIRLSLFDKDGARVGTEFLVESEFAAESSPSVDLLADGRLVVSWTDPSSNTGDSDQGAVVTRILDPRVGTIEGTDRSETLHGRTGDVGDIIDGKGDDDIMIGGRGGDLYFIRQAGDVVREKAGEGTDGVFSAVDWTLSAGESVESLLAVGTSGQIDLTGNEIGQSLSGNDARNTLRGGGGTDTFRGNGGDDTFVVDSLDDLVLEVAGEGTDTVRAQADYRLAGGISVERLRTDDINGTADIDLRGNEKAQSITGNKGDNVLNGRAGNDSLTGGAGNDVFVFNVAVGQANADRIAFFNRADDLLRLDDAVFSAIGSSLGSAEFRKNTSGQAQDATDRILYETDTGKLFYHKDGEGAAGRKLFAILENRPDIGLSDFEIA